MSKLAVFSEKFKSIIIKNVEKPLISFSENITIHKHEHKKTQVFHIEKNQKTLKNAWKLKVFNIFNNTNVENLFFIKVFHNANVDNVENFFVSGKLYKPMTILGGVTIKKDNSDFDIKWRKNIFLTKLCWCCKYLIFYLNRHCEKRLKIIDICKLFLILLIKSIALSIYM